MWFYKIERDNKNKKINVTWNTGVTYMKTIIGAVGVVACLFNVIWLSGICLAIIAGALIYYICRYGDLVQVLHNFERNNALEYKGSQYSFKNPLVVTIPQTGNV